jgi:hypothetical protein
VASAVMMSVALLLAVVGPRAVWDRLVGIVAVGVGLSLQVAALAASGYRIDVTAYESIVIVLEVVAAMLAVAAVLVRLGALARTTVTPHDSAPTEVDAVFWKGAVALWLALWLVIHLSPLVI